MVNPYVAVAFQRKIDKSGGQRSNHFLKLAVAGIISSKLHFFCVSNSRMRFNII